MWLKRWLALLATTGLVLGMGVGASTPAAADTVPMALSVGPDAQARDGSSPALAAASCYEIKTNNPAAPDGAYWLLTPKLQTPEQFFCDQTTDGGGWVLVGKGRDGWQSFYSGQGDRSALLTRDRTPTGFGTVQLPAATIDGLLNGRKVNGLGNNIRVVRARNDTGTQWQTVRFTMPDRDRWTWAFGATHRVTAASFNGTGSGTGTTTSFGTDSNWNRVLFEFSTRQGWRAGWGYGAGASGGSTSGTSYLYTINGSGALPYAEVYVRPTLLATDLDFPVVPNAGSAAVAQRSMASTWASRTPWGVTGNLNGRVAEGNSPVQAFAQIGNTVYVGGNFTTAQRGSSASGSNLVTRTALAAFNATSGELVTSFAPVFDDQVKALVALPNGKLLAAGDFDVVNGQPRVGTVLLDPATGATDTSWNLQIENRISNSVVTVRSLSVAGNYVYLGGGFTHLTGGGVSNVYARHGARVNWANAQPDRNFNPEFDGTVMSVDASNDASRYYAAGYFTQTSTGAANKVAAIQTVAGAPLVAPWPTVWSSSDRSGYQQAILEDGSRVYAGGSEHSIFGYDRTTFERKTGSITLGIGGDFQALASGSGVVYGGCHCASWSYQDAYKWPTPDAGWTQADKIQWVGAWDAATGNYIPEFNPPFLGSNNAGAWSLFVANDGALWAGGDFTGSRMSDTSSQWNGGFVRFPVTDSTPPSTPANFRVTSESTTDVTFAWNAVSGASSYEVLRDDRVVGVSTTTSMTVPLAGARRYFVRAVDAAHNLGASSPVLTVAGGTPLVSGAFTVTKNGLDVTLEASATDPSLTYAWDLGDGSTGSTPQVAHRYLGGGTYEVKLTVTDASGAWARTTQTLELQQPTPADAYGASVFGRGSWAYWRFDEASGTTAADSSGSGNHAIYREGVEQGVNGVIPGNKGARFDGVNDVVVASKQISAPQRYSTEAWFRTSTTRGGKIVGFGGSASGLSSNYDRHVYMRDDGRLVFGVYNGGENTIISPAAYNDGNWHQVVASQTDQGLVLYVDGIVVGTNPQTVAENTVGYWRVGGDRVWSGATSSYFAGLIDEVAIYTTPLTAQDVASHYTLGAPPPNQAPTAKFTHQVSNLTVSFDASESTDPDGSVASYAWEFGDGATATGATATRTYAAEGVYVAVLRVTDDSGAVTSVAKYINVGATVEAPSDAYSRSVFDDVPGLFWEFEETSGATAADTATGRNVGTYQQGVGLGAEGIRRQKTASFDGSNDVVVAQRSQVGPTVYSTEAWFRTTTTSGGKIMGFGNAASGLSSNYDRHVYMRDDGRLVFGVWVDSANTVTSASAYNDGAWHQVVATQSRQGLALYVDGTLVGTNPQSAAQAYTGYWRVGGDSVWDGSSSAYFAGDIDEFAVYPYALSAGQVAQHFALGSQLPNLAPVASFTYEAAYLDVDFDASASSDPDGSIDTISWDFGDNTAVKTGAEVSHKYAAAGTYVVTVTVKDNEGAEGVSTQSLVVVAPPNQAPSASFTYQADYLDVDFDASASSDPDGSIDTLSWDFGDGSPVKTGATTSHKYTAEGTFQVTLTVTDNDGASSVAQQWVTVADVPPNQAPVASFTYEAAYLDVDFDASASSDPDGSIDTISWDFGDNTAVKTGAEVSHKYAAAGTYVVTVTVKDNEGAESSSSQSLVVVAAPTNQPPSASFTHSVAGLRVSVDASASSDPDGSIDTISWNFGDQSSAKTGTKVSHDYAAAGTYVVTLSVTDNDGATTTSTSSVTVTEPADEPVTTRVIDSGASWAYRYQQGAPPATWAQRTFDDGAWARGNGPVGYGSAVVATNLNPSSTTADRPIAVYARTSFQVADVAKVQQLAMSVVADDGAVVYVNGTEVGRQNIATNPVTYQTYADSARRVAVAQASPLVVEVPTNLLVNGMNVVAVETHVNYRSSADLTLAATADLTEMQAGSGPNTAPIASFTHSVEDLRLSVDATDSSDPDGSIESVSWDFGDNSAVVTGVKRTHTYTSAGTYVVTLTVTDNKGASSTTSSSVTLEEPAGEPVTTRVVNTTSSWSYFYQVTAPPTAWAQREFDDSSWARGLGPIGYGSSIVTTNLNPSANTNDRPRAVYARTTFEVANAASVTGLALSVLSDDGAVVYVNGVEVGRENLGTVPVTYLTYADSARRTTVAQASPLLVTVPVNLLVDGVNVISVESHVNYRGSADLALAATADLTVRQPAQ